MSLTSEQITAHNFKDFYDTIKPYLGIVHAGFTPVGAVISMMGTTAPVNYAKCDGTIYNISTYPELANYFNDQYGSKNYFGGDGTTTFAVPNISGPSPDAFYCIAVKNVITDAGNNYSLDEQVVGSYIDGKMVYQKLVNVPVPVSSSNTLTESLVALGVAVDHYVDLKGFLSVDGWTTNISWGVPNLSSTGVIISAYDDSDTSGTKNQVGIMYQGDLTDVDSIILVVQYTKVTG